MLPFRKRLTLQQRTNEYARIKQKCPAYIPVICEKHRREDPDLDREKFLVPMDLTAVQLLFVLRKRMHLNRDQAVFLFVDNTLVTGSTTLQSIQSIRPSEDGFLYVQYSLENTFG